MGQQGSESCAAIEVTAESLNLELFPGDVDTTRFITINNNSEIDLYFEISTEDLTGVLSTTDSPSSDKDLARMISTKQINSNTKFKKFHPKNSALSSSSIYALKFDHKTRMEYLTSQVEKNEAKKKLNLQREAKSVSNNTSYDKDNLYSGNSGGGSITFTKDNWADYNDPDNWDCITDNVCITRGNERGLYNPLFQDCFYCGLHDRKDDFSWDYDRGTPYGTEWAWGRTEDVSSNTDIKDDRGVTMPSDTMYTWWYTDWENAVSQSGCGGPRDALNGNCGPAIMSLHLIEEDIYYDVEYHWWQHGTNNGGEGGGNGGNCGSKGFFNSTNELDQLECGDV